MGFKCAIANCNTMTMNGKSAYAFHTFPNPDKGFKKQHKLWLSVVRMLSPDYKVNTASRICSKHFTHSCFKDTQKPLLLDHAIPTLYIGAKSKPKRVLTLGNIKNELKKKLKESDKKKKTNAEEKNKNELKIKPEMLKKKMINIMNKKDYENEKMVKNLFKIGKSPIDDVKKQSKNKHLETKIEKVTKNKVTKDLCDGKKTSSEKLEDKDEVMEISDESVEEVEECYDENEFQYVPQVPVNVGDVNQTCTSPSVLNLENLSAMSGFMMNPNANFVPGFVSLDSAGVLSHNSMTQYNCASLNDGFVNWEEIMKSNVNKVWNNCKIVEKVIQCKSRGTQCEMGHEIIRNMQVDYETFVLAPHFLSAV